MTLKKYIKIIDKEELKGKDFREIEYQQDYKQLLKKEEKIKSDFHGNRDFYNLIKGVAIEVSKLNKLNKKKKIFKNYFSFFV